MSRSRLYHQAFYNLLYASCFIFYNVLNPLRRRHSDTVLKHKFTVLGNLSVVELLLQRRTWRQKAVL